MIVFVFYAQSPTSIHPLVFITTAKFPQSDRSGGTTIPSSPSAVGDDDVFDDLTPLMPLLDLPPFAFEDLVVSKLSEGAAVI